MQEQDEQSDQTAGKPSLRVLGEKVLVRQEAFRQQVGSLYIPDGNRAGFEDRGTVEAVGSRVYDVKVGDRVIFKRKPASALNAEMRGSQAKVFQDLLSLTEADILAVIED